MVHSPLSSDSLRLLRSAVDRSKRTSSVQLPIEFVRTADGQTPLKHIQQDGRGEGLRLRLMLSMLMFATRAPHKLHRAAPGYARMLDMADPEGEGSRRVNGAQRWLASQKYISRDATQQPPEITMLRCDRSGRPWVVSGKRWITIPLEMWTNGWIVALSGRALAIYLVLREVTGGRADGASVPRRRRAEYGLSPDTWKRGCDELVAHGLIEVTPQLVSDDEDWGLRVKRNVYRVIPGGLSKEPTKLAAP